MIEDPRARGEARRAEGSAPLYSDRLISSTR